jgi:hypothetical protein
MAEFRQRGKREEEQGAIAAATAKGLFVRLLFFLVVSQPGEIGVATVK